MTTLTPCACLCILVCKCDINFNKVLYVFKKIGVDISCKFLLRTQFAQMPKTIFLEKIRQICTSSAKFAHFSHIKKHGSTMMCVLDSSVRGPGFAPRSR